MALEKIVELISEQFNVDEDSINLETSFRDDLNADSLDLVELVMAFEDEFGIEVEDEDMDSIKTVGDVTNYIRNILGDDI